MSVNVTTLLDIDMRTQMVLDKMAYEQVCAISYMPGPACPLCITLRALEASHAVWLLCYLVQIRQHTYCILS